MKFVRLESGPQNRGTRFPYPWLRRNPVVVAPIVGAMKTSHIDDAVAALSITLSDDEAAQLEAPYTPRYDTQGVSDPRELARISAAIGIKPDTA